MHSRPPAGPDAGPPGGPESPPAGARSELRFAAAIAAIGAAILLMALVLLALPSVLSGPPLIVLIAYGTAALFGPVAFTLLAQAWRIRNRVRHGTVLPAGQRRAAAGLGAALIVVGVFLVFSDFGVSGALSRILNIVWGISLAAYGLRLLVRALVSGRE